MASSTTPNHEVAASTDLESYTDVLDSDTAVANIMSKGPNSLTPAQRRRQRTLYKFFNTGELPLTAVPKDPLSLLAGSRKRKYTSEDDTVSRRGWGEGALKRVKLPLTIADFMAAHLQRNRTGDATVFLDTMGLMRPISNGKKNGSSSEDHFERLAQNIYASNGQAGKNAIRWLYLMLCVYDVFCLKFPRISRVSSKMKEVFRTDLQSHMEQAAPDDEVGDTMRMTGYVNVWFNSGHKLDNLCKEFGDGSLIILVDLLTQDFVENWMTKTGKAKDYSFEFFKSHQLKEVTEKSGANLLGKDLRRTLLGAHPV